MSECPQNTSGARLCRRASAIAALVLLATPGTAAADETRSFAAVRERDGVAVFHVRGVRPSALRLAHVEVGAARIGLRERTLRRSMADGRVDVRLGARLAREPGMATLVLNTRDLPGVDYVDSSEGRVVKTVSPSRLGRPTAYATYRGGSGNGYARGVIKVDWKEGDTVRYGATLRLPKGFHDRVQGQVDLLRWDNWPSAGDSSDWGGVGIWGSDRRARLLRFGAERDSIDVLGGPLRLPEGRWFRLEVRQRLSAKSARSELLVDGKVVDRSRAPTAYGLTIERIRVGIVAIDSSRQRKSLGVFFSDPFAEKIARV